MRIILSQFKEHGDNALHGIEISSGGTEYIKHFFIIYRGKQVKVTDLPIGFQK